MGFRKRIGGYLILQRETEREPLHVHVFKDNEMIAKYDLVRGCFIREPGPRHRGRVLAALVQLGLIKDPEEVG
ncbi:MAG: hypothetical protein FJ125_05700 [Deltaproteobacteria bacterium]|nr:hypothetical protein [Deltaproteobacteria bacterium]